MEEKEKDTKEETSKQEETEKKENSNKKNTNKEKKKTNKKSKCEEELEELKKQLSEQNEKYLRVYAELENFKKRMEKESSDKLKFANQRIITDLLTVIDHLEMAITHITSESSVETLKEGVELTLKQFSDILNKFGVKEIELEIGDEFDPNLHEAMMLANDPNVKNNKVTMILQKGFTLNDRVIRPAKVQVNKVSEINKDEEIKEDSNE